MGSTPTGCTRFRILDYEPLGGLFVLLSHFAARVWLALAFYEALLVPGTILWALATGNLHSSSIGGVVLAFILDYSVLLAIALRRPGAGPASK